MKTRIVYVVVFDDSNYYFEQAMVSACSVRMHNPDAEIVVVTDRASEALITGWLRDIGKYVNTIVGVDVPSELNKMQRSRWIKTNLRNLIDGDFLFLDTDTVICRSLESIDNATGDICAVVDWNSTFAQARTNGYTLDKFRQAGWTIEADTDYFNSGVLFVRDNEKTRAFFTEWHNNWLSTSSKGVYIDQVSLYHTNRHFGYVIQNLNGEWNCQTEGKFINYLSNAYVLHYFAFANDWDGCMFYFKSRKVFEEIREQGCLPPTVIKKLSDPYRAFLPNYEVLSGAALQVYRACDPIMKLYGSPRRFRVLKWVAKLLSR